MARLKKKRLNIVHADIIVVAERPDLGPHFPAMKNILCPMLGIRRDRLGLKAKTNEGLGPVGRGKAIACWAIVLVGKRS
jgi:2-C-methyl-D-erythritol 2,4-cyclodiphosphate synthase